MAVGEAAPVDDHRGFQWSVTLFPAIPIVALVLRLWSESGQDLNTMLLLVQHVHALELASSLVISVLEAPPALLLVGHLLGLLSLVSAESPVKSRLERTAERTPNWLVVAAVMWAALVWELRFLPTLLMLGCAVAGLTAHRRGRADLVFPVGVLLPVVVGVAEYSWFGPAILDALATGEVALVLLLAVPPLLGPLLTGALPESVARMATHGLATAGALVVPFVLLSMFLRVPVLPSVALELLPAQDRPAEIVLGSVVTVDDTMTTILDGDSGIRFVDNDLIKAKALCRGAESVPYSSVDAHGWLVEDAMLDWLLPAKTRQGAVDPLCEGRLP